MIHLISFTDLLSKLVVFRLSMSGEIDCSRCDVHVHNPVDNLGLKVALVLVDHVLLPGVEQLDEGEVCLVLFRDWLVDLFVVFYSLKEVCDGLKCTNTKNIIKEQ